MYITGNISTNAFNCDYCGKGMMFLIGDHYCGLCSDCIKILDNHRYKENTEDGAKIHKAWRQSQSNRRGMEFDEIEYYKDEIKDIDKKKPKFDYRKYCENKLKELEE